MGLEEEINKLTEKYVEDNIKVTKDSRIEEDLGLDSLDQYELIHDIENKYNINIPMDDSCQIKQIKDVYKYINGIV